PPVPVPPPPPPPPAPAPPPALPPGLEPPQPLIRASTPNTARTVRVAFITLDVRVSRTPCKRNLELFRELVIFVIHKAHITPAPDDIACFITFITPPNSRALRRRVDHGSQRVAFRTSPSGSAAHAR